MDVSEREIIRWKVADLHSSPYQARLFDDLPDQELAEMVEDMRVHSQRAPLEIRPNGEIVDGHQRKRAAEVLGWETVAVVVRDDLAHANSDEIECEMIDANLHRRQLGVLEVARLYARLRQIARGWDADEFFGAVKQDVRDRLAKRLGNVSGRTLDRYLRLLLTPREVQDAVSRQELAMSAALRVAKLSADDKATIAAAIRGGQAAKDAVTTFFEARRSRTANTATHELLAALSSTVPASSEATTTATDDGEDLGVLQGPVDCLDSAIGDVIRAELPPKRKIEAFVQATACLEVLLDEAEMEAAE